MAIGVFMFQGQCEYGEASWLLGETAAALEVDELTLARRVVRLLLSETPGRPTG